MASLVEELIDTLSNEYTLYKELLPIAEKKTKVIIKNDLDELQTITDVEQDFVDKITALERKREEIITNMGTVINRDPKTLNLKGIIQILKKQPKEQKELSVLHDNLTRTIQTLVEINNRNKSLIHQSLEMIEFNMNFIQSTRMSPGNNYTKKGATSYDTSMGRRTIFDAKQ